MAKKDLFALLGDLDKVYASTVAFGPIRGAHRVVKELQKEGPSWTGRFSNSWQISTPDGRTYRGDGLSGEPRTLNIPLLTGPQALKAGFAKDKIVFTISNFSPWAGEATDLRENSFYRPSLKPETQLGLSKWEISSSKESRSNPGLRGNIPSPVGRVDAGGPSRTAELDWFTTYVTGGRLDRSVTIEMDNMLRRL